MMEFFAGMGLGFAALGIWGMAVVGLALAGALFCAFNERGWQASIAVLAALAAWSFFGEAKPWMWVVENPGWAALAVMGYFAAGSAWSVVKFQLYAGALKSIFREFKAEWLAQNGKGASSVEGLNPAELVDFRQAAESRMRRAARHGSYPVAPSAHKAVILFWMGWWPVSLVAYLLDEPIKKIMNALFRMFSGVYAKISERESREYRADMGQ